MTSVTKGNKGVQLEEIGVLSEAWTTGGQLTLTRSIAGNGIA